MNKKISDLLMAAMLLVSANISAQTLSVQPIEVQTDGQAEVVVNLTDATAMTALQFNLQLPEGMAVSMDGITLGTATDGHTLTVETLDGGDMLFVLYSMDQNCFKDGELLRIPMKAGDKAFTANGKLYTVRTATTEAVSHAFGNVQFSMIVKGPVSGDANGDGNVDIVDVTSIIDIIL